MAFDSFIKFQGGPTPIVGESQDSVYKGAFEIKEFSFGAETTLNITSATGGAGAGQATFKEFKVKKQTDSASPLLLQCLGTGDHYSLVQLFIRKSGAAAGAGGKGGKSGKAYLVYAFGMVAVKSIDWSGQDGDDVPTEEVTFEYGEMFVSYWQQQASGELTPAPAIGSWSKLQNSVDTELISSTDASNN
jgi:type VI secretion system secreted protein Hcp